MKKNKPTLYLIDGNSYVYRAFYAIRGLSTSRGFPTNAVYGFTNMLMKVAGEKKPDYLAVCFDPKGPTTRHAAYVDYKATRPPMPDALQPQIPYIHRIVEAMGIPVLLVPGVEADDVIAAVARKAGGMGFDVTIVTGDKDLFQLIDENIKVYDTMKDEVYGEAECIAKFGVPPSKIPDLLGLTGDTSDNIPGVPGIGPKTAVGLIAEYGTIEGLLAQVDKITKPKLREALIKHAEDARLSRRLVELMKDLPEEVDIEGLKQRPQDSRELIELFKELEFTALLKFVTPGAKTEAVYVTVGDADELKKLAAEIKKAGELAVAAAATSMLPMDGEPVGIALCFGGRESYYVPFGHIARKDGELLPSPAAGQLPMGRVIEILRPVLEDPGIRKYGHNIKYDMIVLANMGVELAGEDFDSMVGSYLLNPGRASHNIESVALEQMSFKKMPLSEAAGTGAKQVPYSHVDIGTATRYSAEYAYLAFTLTKVLREKLEAVELIKLFNDIELPLIRVLAGVERSGVYVDTGYLQNMSRELAAMLDSAIKDIYASAGGEFNINSPKQLSTVLFEKLGLSPLKKTKSGYSTDEEVLTALAASHALPARILEYRELFKLKSTYVDSLSKLVNPRTGRVHTSLNQAVTATGRLSSSEPNLQNIPIRGDLGGRIRKAFAAPEGRMIISADYSQVELRIMAHLAHDASFIESFKKGEDVHTRTASEIFCIEPDAVTSEMRRRAKAVNFGIMYGISPYGLSVQIGVHPREAGKYIDAYFERHKGVREYIRQNLEEVKKNGYATTIFGRKRPIPELMSDNHATRSLGERLAVNTPIQGSAADLIKVAMINIARRLKEEGLKTLMILQVHDELVFETPVDEVDRVKALVKEEMEGAIKLDVPIRVDVGVGKSWGEAH
jgi:DNA polymerase-1